MRIIVLGAGVIGALTAYRLAQKGADVTVVDAGHPAQCASGASFGWINASFYLDQAHFALRFEGIAAHRRLSSDLGTDAIRWQQTLCWEESGAAFDAQYDALRKLDYGVDVLSKKQVSELEPAIKAPNRAMIFKDEGIANLVTLSHDALTAAKSLGARLILGVLALGVETHNERVIGVRWSGGVIPCDAIVLATGVATQELLAGVGLHLPMLVRPGLLMRSVALPPILAHILVTPEGELRQDVSGRILAPTAVAHQSDQTDAITEDPKALADKTSARVSALLQKEVTWDEVRLAYRPVPGDQQPVMGAVGPAGLYVSTMHSGATLAPLAAEFIACELMQETLTGTQSRLIAPYRPQRFIV